MKPFADSGIKNTNAYDNTMFIFIYLFIYSFFNVDNYRTNTVYNKK